MGVGCLIAAHWITFFAAIDFSNVSIALACMASTSVFAAFMEPMIYKRRLAIDEVLTSLLAMIGVMLIFGVSTGFELGIGCALISSALAATFTIINGILYKQNVATWASKGGSGLMTTYEMLGGFLAIGVYQMFFGTELGGWNLTDQNIVLAIVLGVVCTAIPFAAAIYVMRSLSPFTACITVNLEPVYAIMLALLHFGESERMTTNFYLATLLIIGAVMINGLLKYRKASSGVSEEIGLIS